MTEGVKRGARLLVAGMMVTVACAGTATAQSADDPNPGALTFTGNFDVPSLYVFRGIVQEVDPKFTAFPSADSGSRSDPARAP